MFAIKKVIPEPIRNTLRPYYQWVERRWDESLLKPRPKSWFTERDALRSAREFHAILANVRRFFGITQIEEEIEGLIDVVRKIKPTTVVEIGTHKGGNSMLFAFSLPTARHLVGIDLCVQNAGKIRFFASPERRYSVIHGNSQIPETRRRLERILAGAPIDFLFIDGDHSYEGVRRDYELYSPLVRDGGIIAFHDIVADHRTRFGKETGCYAGGVHRLWAEVKVASPRWREFVRDPDQDGFGIGVIWR
jgi:predicted O-methyltransferase YrrM